MLNIVLFLVAIGISFFLWERFKGFRYLVLIFALCVFGVIGYFLYDSHVESRKAELVEFEQRYAEERRIEFKKKHPEYDFPCIETKESTSPYREVPEACIPGWNNQLIDRAIQAEKDGKALPLPIPPRKPD